MVMVVVEIWLERYNTKILNHERLTDTVSNLVDNGTLVPTSRCQGDSIDTSITVSDW